MKLQENLNLQAIYGLSYKQIQLLSFLLIFPLVNMVLFATILYSVREFEYHSVALGGLKLWMVFSAAWMVIHIIETTLHRHFNNSRFWPQFAMHLIVVLSLLYHLEPLSHIQLRAQFPNTVIGPRIVITMEICIYLIFLRVLRQQARAFEIEKNLKETELNMLRSQNNPHFLFNTLNLINSEISNDPDNAKEIVFDLSDLLRKNLRLAKQRFTTLEEEMALVNLYLSLQQKRFKNRLTYAINMAPETKLQRIPTLLLQPIVENTVKHAVAPYAAESQITIKTSIEAHRLQITFKDTGPKFDDTHIKEGDGFRILKETLHLNYNLDFSIDLQSTPDGGIFTLSLPVRTNANNDSEKRNE